MKPIDMTPTRRTGAPGDAGGTMSFMKLPEPRPLSRAEKQVLDLMLSSDFPGAVTLRSQIPSVRVVARCDCGCATVNLEVAPQEPRATDVGNGVLPVTGYVGSDIHQTKAGIIVFVDDGYLSSLEIYSLAEPAPPEWPDLAEVWLFANS
jgi:hypothetical protein